MAEPNIAQRFPYVMDMQPGTYKWCACGGSKNQPFCDGTHKGSSFSPIRADIAAPGKVKWCGCKHTKTPPFCDGSHNALPSVSV